MNVELQKIKEYAIHCHESTNHRYGNDEPYSLHLQMAVDVALQFIDLVPEEERDAVIAALWCHDLLEDTRQTYNDIMKVVRYQDIAELVFALTNNKGRNRKERANWEYYKGLASIPYGMFCKLCDRIANVQYSKNTGSKMFEMYRKENEDFLTTITSLHTPEIYLLPMYDHLRSLFD